MHMQFLNGHTPNALRYPANFYRDFDICRPLGYGHLARLVRWYRNGYGVKSRQERARE